MGVPPAYGGERRSPWHSVDAQAKTVANARPDTPPSSRPTSTSDRRTPWWPALPPRQASKTRRSFRAHSTSTTSMTLRWRCWPGWTWARC